MRCLVATTILVAVASYVSAQSYEVQVVRETINSSFTAVALNDHGDLGGRDSIIRPNQAATFIGGQYARYVSQRGNSYGLDMNNSGTLVGYHDDSDPTGAYWTADGTYHPIPLLERGTSSLGLTIDDDGTIAGVASDRFGSPQMAIWRNGEIETFGWIPSTWNAGVRDYGGGKFIGDLYGTVEGDYQGSFIFDTVTRELTTYDTQSTERPFTMLWDINNLGQAVGEEHLGLGIGYGGVMIDDGIATSFGTGFKPSRISDEGVITGDTEDHQDRLVYRDGVIERIDDLLPTGWDITILGEINNRGQMLVRGSFEGGPVKQLLLTPVPEPTTCATLLLGAALLYRKRSKTQP